MVTYIFEAEQRMQEVTIDRTPPEPVPKHEAGASVYVYRPVATVGTSSYPSSETLMNHDHDIVSTLCGIIRTVNLPVDTNASAIELLASQSLIIRDDHTCHSNC